MRAENGQLAVILLVVLGIVAIHTVEIWLYGFAFWAIGAVHDFESALYFSTVTFTTLGYGDIVLDGKWRLFGAIEAGNGLILFGWSTAFLLSVTGRLRMLEHDWLERRMTAGCGRGADEDAYEKVSAWDAGAALGDTLVRSMQSAPVSCRRALAPR